MKRVLLIVFVVFCAAKVSYGTYQTIALDADFSDWASVPGVTDRDSDNVQ